MADWGDIDDIMRQFFGQHESKKPEPREPGEGEIKCSTCKGLGSVRKLRKTFLGQMMTVSHCSQCKGTGVVSQN